MNEWFEYGLILGIAGLLVLYASINQQNQPTGLAGGSSSDDSIPPLIVINKPANNSTIEETIVVSITANDNIGIAKVEMFLDGKAKFVDTTQPFDFFLRTYELSNGEHLIQAKAFDRQGNAALSKTIKVFVMNKIVDTIAPNVSLVYPNGGSFSGTIQITASASDNFAINAVRFYLDGNLIGESSTPSGNTYTLPWDSKTAANGLHSIYAKATDSTGNSATSNKATISLNN